MFTPTPITAEIHIFLQLNRIQLQEFVSSGASVPILLESIDALVSQIEPVHRMHIENTHTFVCSVESPMTTLI
jgi:hypothetical protein